MRQVMDVRFDVLSCPGLGRVDIRRHVPAPTPSRRHHSGLQHGCLEVLRLELRGLGAVDEVAGPAAPAGGKLSAATHCVCYVRILGGGVFVCCEYVYGQAFGVSLLVLVSLVFVQQRMAGSQRQSRPTVI